MKIVFPLLSLLVLLKPSQTLRGISLGSEVLLWGTSDYWSSFEAITGLFMTMLKLYEPTDPEESVKTILMRW
jgi:hypothetical protein